MKANRFLLLFTVAVLFAGCFKDVSYKTNYILKPLVQKLSADPIEPFEGVKAFAFAADTAFYTVASYEDALNGVISLKDNPSGQISTPLAAAEPYVLDGATGWVQMPLSSPSQMILAVDPTHKIYAYTQQELEVNLPNLYVSLVFKPWKEGFSYKDGNWSFYNQFYTPPIFLDCFIEPSIQIEEGGAAEAISSLKAYAYAADTTAWYIASYDDAVAGKITSKSDDAFTRSTPNFTAYKEENSARYKMEVSTATLMVVVVDRTNRLYAYSQQEVDLDGEAVTLPLVFRPWRAAWIYVEEGWRVVDTSLAPEKPNTQSQFRRR